jgi:MFS family permease
MRAPRTGLVALIAASAVSAAGTSMTALAVPWYVLASTGRALDTGIVAGAELAGLAISSVLGAPVADRWGTRRVAIASDLMAGLAVLAIPLMSATVGLQLGLLAALAALMGLTRGPGDTARYALLPDVAEQAGLSVPRSAGWFDGSARTARLIGGPLAGVLIAALGPPAVLLVDAASFAVSALVITLAVPATAPHAAESESESESESAPAPEAEPSGSVRAYGRQLGEGVARLRADPLSLAVVAMVAAANTLDAAWISVLLPVFARQRLGSSVALGVLVAAFGAGSVGGAAAYGWAADRLPRRSTFAVCFLIAGAPRFAALVLLPAVLAAHTVALVLLGVANGALGPIIMATVLARTPAGLRARVVGAVHAGALAPTPLGTMIAGLAIELTGWNATVTAMAVAYLAITLWPVLSPVWRGLDDEQQSQRQADVPAPGQAQPQA